MLASTTGFCVTQTKVPMGTTIDLPWFQSLCTKLDRLRKYAIDLFSTDYFFEIDNFACNILEEFHWDIGIQAVAQRAVTLDLALRMLGQYTLCSTTHVAHDERKIVAIAIIVLFVIKLPKYLPMAPWIVEELHTIEWLAF